MLLNVSFSDKLSAPGSKLGPLMYMLFTNDLADVFSFAEVNVC